MAKVKATVIMQLSIPIEVDVAITKEGAKILKDSWRRWAEKESATVNSIEVVSEGEIK